MNYQDFLKVPEGYSYSKKDGVVQIMNPDFKNKLEPFLAKFLEIQKAEKFPVLPSHLILNFPFVDYKPLKNEITSRQQDIAILNELLLKTEPGLALEIGGWNGWLTKWLSQKKYEIISADIFSDEINGLESKKYHTASNWISFHADITETNFYTKKFKLIVINHCLQFLPLPFELTAKYKGLLAPGGKLIIAGISSHILKKRQELKKQKFREYFHKKYNFQILFYESKGYFEKGDFQHFLNAGFKFISYEFSLSGKLKRFITGEKTGILYYEQQ